MVNIEKIKITTLAENSVADIDFVAEWGFSTHIAIDGEVAILFDTGYRNACTHNAAAAGIQLSAVDMIVLSHGHTDHTGGLKAVLETIRQQAPQRETVDIVCHPAAIESQHVKHTDQYFYRGCPHHIEELIRLGARFQTLAQPRWLTENVVTSGEVPMQTDFETVAPICYLKKDQTYVNSPVEDDQALFVTTDKGLVIVLGCAHRGMINTILHARELTGVKEVYMVIGGSHLINTSRRQQLRTLEAIQDLGIKKVGVSHCTGMRPAALLAEKLGPEIFFFNHAGTKITFAENHLIVKAFEKQ